MIELAMMATGIGAVYAIVYWSIRNEGVHGIEDQQGFLRMRPPRDPNAATRPDAGSATGTARGRRGRWAAPAPASRRPGSGNRGRR